MQTVHAAVEAATGAEYTGDESQYGQFRDGDGNAWQAHVEPSRSNSEIWCITFEASE